MIEAGDYVNRLPTPIVSVEPGDGCQPQARKHPGGLKELQSLARQSGLLFDFSLEAAVAETGANTRLCGLLNRRACGCPTVATTNRNAAGR
jgi:hypothetical protein